MIPITVTYKPTDWGFCTKLTVNEGRAELKVKESVESEKLREMKGIARFVHADLEEVGTTFRGRVKFYSGKAVANMQSSNGQLQHVYVFPTELASDADYVPSEAFEKAAESPDRILVSEEDFNAALKLNALQSQLTFFDIVNKARKSFEELPEEKKEWLRKFVTPEQAEKIRKDVIEFARTAQESKQ